MIGIFYFYDNWFVRDENNRNLNNLFQKLVCSPSKVPISTRIILRNTINRSRMFNQLLLAQNIQISIIFLSVKSIIIKIKEWDHMSLTSNISAKTWSNWTCRGVLKMSGPAVFKSVPGFENWPRFVGVIEQNKIYQTYDHLCTYLYIKFFKKYMREKDILTNKAADR